MRSHFAAFLSALLVAVCSDAAIGSFAPEHPSPVVSFSEADTHALGRGLVRTGNAVVEGGTASLTLPAHTFDGAEIRSVERFGYGVYEARMKTPRAPGTLSAFFLYEGGSDIADELDVELFNDGSRRVMFTTWVAGKTTHTATLQLPFDPADGFHDYRIEWSRDRVRFLVDGVVMQEWRDALPANPMHVMANTWWPTWISGPRPDTPQSLQIDRIRAAL
ncbi:MAG TPA: family 16 glycosylhydrolase [Longimicrobium sp.]|jgi:beta-glucanase (GH16 family)